MDRPSTEPALSTGRQDEPRTGAREFESLLAEPAALAAYVSHVKQCRVALLAEHEATLVEMIALASGARRELTVAQRELLLKQIKSEGLPPSLLDEVLKSRAIAVVAARKVDPVEQIKLPLQPPALDGSYSARFRTG